MNSEQLQAASNAGNVKKMKEVPKEKASSGSENQRPGSQVVEKPCTQIYKFLNVRSENKCDASFPSHDKKQYFKCADYGSDEFADVEDNAKDSSSENGESASNDKFTIYDKYEKEIFPSGTGIESQTAKPIENSRILEESVSDSSSSSQNEVVNKDGRGVAESKISNIENINVGASCSFVLGDNTISTPASNDEGKKIEFKMPTIAEVAEFEDNLKNTHSSRSRANPLKMKTKVGMRKDKCNVCRVRLGLCAIKCRCGGYYCAKHRYDKEHNCTFDYKTMGAEEIRKNNPRVIAEKVRKL